MTHRDKLAAGLRAMGYAPEVTPRAMAYQRFVHFRLRSLVWLGRTADAALFACRAGGQPVPVDRARVARIIRAGRRLTAGLNGAHDGDGAAFP